MPNRLSATAVEALRACPYQLLRARGTRAARRPAELDEEADHARLRQRWLHATLQRLPHPTQRANDDRVELQRLQPMQPRRHWRSGRDADSWPFRAAFDDFARRYVAWLHERDARGLVASRRAKLERRTAPPALGGVVIDGRLDRIDRVPGRPSRWSDRLQDRPGGQAQATRSSSGWRTPSSRSMPRWWPTPTVRRPLPCTCALTRQGRAGPHRAQGRGRDRTAADRRPRCRPEPRCARAQGLRHWASRRPATTALRAACAGATIGARDGPMTDAAYRHRRRGSSRPTPSTPRPAIRAAAWWSKPAPVPARPGCWWRASCARAARRRRAAGDPGHHLHPQGRGRDAHAPGGRAWLRLRSRMTIRPGGGRSWSATAWRRGRPRQRLPHELIGLHEQLLHGGRMVEVRTFHAWFSQLLRAAPLELLADLQLAPGLALIEDIEDLRPELMQPLPSVAARRCQVSAPTTGAWWRAMAASTVLNQWLDKTIEARRVPRSNWPMPQGCSRAAWSRRRAPWPMREPARRGLRRTAARTLARALGARAAKSSKAETAARGVVERARAAGRCPGTLSEL